MQPYYDAGGITIYHADSEEVLADWPFDVDQSALGCVVVDPPWDDRRAVAMELPPARDFLVFTDPRRMGQTVARYGSGIAWVFTWDTMNSWATGKARPVQQSKFCLWYGDLGDYDRDATLWGDRPPERNHPSTKQTPLDGRRLVDLWRESLRWLHHPGAGSGSAGVERFGKRQGDSVLRHAKPLGWVRCILGNCTAGVILDPFLGSGTTLRAAKDLGRRAIGIDVDERCCEVAASRLGQEVLFAEEEGAQ